MTQRTEVLGLITARGDSRGIPRKALVDLGGQPLIAWTVAAGKRSAAITRLVTSTDSADVAAAAREAGSEVPFLRPAELATDTAAHVLTAEHALDWLQATQGYIPDYVVLLQPTSPLRTAADIDGAVRLAIETGSDAVVSVCPADTHPLQAKAMLPDGLLTDFVPGPRAAYVRRQDLAPAYAVNGAIFVNRTVALRRDRAFAPPGARAFLMPPDRSVDINTEWDLEMARLIVASGRVDR